MNLLSLNDVTMQFGGVVAVNNLSLTVKKGEIVSLIGPNGAGKSTVFNVITGVYAPTNGVVSFDGEKMIENYPKGKMKRLYAGENREKYTKTMLKRPDEITKLGIARTFQNIRLFRSMTVFENVLTAMHVRRTSNVFSAVFRINHKEETDMREKSAALLKSIGLEQLQNMPPSSLSYGNQRQLEIVRALAPGPKLLLLDEPAAGMNPQESEELAEFILKIHRRYELTILLIEHHMDMVMGISDKIYVVDFGKLLASGTPEEIQQNQAVIDAYLGGAEDG